MAMLILHSTKLLFYLAALMIIGLATGLLTGTTAALVMKHIGIKNPNVDGKMTAVKKAGAT